MSLLDFQCLKKPKRYPCLINLFKSCLALICVFKFRIESDNPISEPIGSDRKRNPIRSDRFDFGLTLIRITDDPKSDPRQALLKLGFKRQFQ